MSDLAEIQIHLDTHLLNGGDYRGMLAEAKRLQARGASKGKYSRAFIQVDADRAEYRDWDRPTLMARATEENLHLIYQRPNLEGVLLRLFPDHEALFLDKTATQRALMRNWPNYDKNFSAHDLIKKFSLNDLHRMASHDLDILNFLEEIGFPVSAQTR